MIEVIFYRGVGTWQNRLIRAWTRSPYSHCELHFGAGLCFSSAPGVGTRWKNISINPSEWDRVMIPSADTSWEKLRDFCNEENGCGYDWRGILCSQVLPLGWYSEHRWFCSEVCVAALQHVGCLAGVTPCAFSPGRLHRRLIEGA